METIIYNLSDINIRNNIGNKYISVLNFQKYFQNYGEETLNCIVNLMFNVKDIDDNIVHNEIISSSYCNHIKTGEEVFINFFHIFDIKHINMIEYNVKYNINLNIDVIVTGGQSDESRLNMKENVYENVIEICTT